MAKKSWKIYDDNFKESMTFPQGIPWNFHDRNPIGDVYVVVFKTAQINRKTAHHAILVDVAGSSNEENMEGVLVHLTASTITQQVKFRVEDDPWSKDCFYETVRVGQLTTTKSNPQFWAIDLHNKAYELYCSFTDQITKIKWSSSVNCQTFARALLNEFGLEWPHELPYASDRCLPVIIDIAIQVISIKASKQKKCEEAFQKTS
ncbi:unnamed protein product [Rotaria magnacalcarata]|uniref:Uncharacterized protein n=2 Tax=Rotaria magnacalcarata TaxID=392030 RepID=A0A814E4G6_9BILA|nr:unnamed protein product [Rotaria magnacalcarata]CAF1644319.1 unnamed protein product [Rotaria magnacalcarata]